MENGGSTPIRELEEELAAFCPVVSFREGDLIYSPYQQDTVAYVIQRGRVKLYHLDESGKKLTLAILGEGSLFGEMALVGEELRQTNAEALEETACWAIEREQLLARAKSHPDLLVQLLELLLQRMSETQQRLKELVFKDLETRLARMLLQLMNKYGRKRHGRWEIELKITHQELAELVGGTRENVTMILNRFEEEGLIAKQRFQIAITDPEQLSKRAALDSLKERVSEN